MSEQLHFLAADDKILIKTVSKFSCLYDVECSSYKNQTVKDNAWKEIAECVRRPVDDCKKRWRNIKDTYYRRLRKGKRTRSASSKAKSWPLFDMLAFLGKVEHKRRSTSNIDEESYPKFSENITENITIDVSPSPTSSSSSSTPKGQFDLSNSCNHPGKRQKLNDNFLKLMEERWMEQNEVAKCPTQLREDDDVDVFFKSIAISVKKLRPALINEAKMKSLQMVIELESRNTKKQ